MPAEIMIAAVGAVNSIISSLFATNCVGSDAMSAVQLFSPVQSILMAFSLMLIGGTQILCGKFIGMNQKEQVQKLFSLNLVVSIIFSVIMILVLASAALFHWTSIIAPEPEVRVLFDQYIIGNVIGILPLVIGQQLTVFLIIQQHGIRARIAGIIYVVFNLALNYLFVVVMDLSAFGLALATSIAMWVFMIIEAQFFFTKKSQFRIRFNGFRLKGSGELMKTGLPGSLTQGYLTVRGIIVNALITTFAGSVGLSAFGASNMLLNLFWAIPTGMLTVSRLLMSVAIGEEDRTTLVDIMRAMFKRFIPIMSLVSAILIACSVPLAKLYFQDTSDPVFGMTVWGIRILPLCMPLSVICMHFACYWQIMNRQKEVHLISILDGVVSVSAFSWLLCPILQLNGVYIANVLNGLVSLIVIILIPWVHSHRFPKGTEALLEIPESFGVPESDRLGISLTSMEEVVNISETIQTFCKEKGAGDRRSYLAGLAMEEMAGNVIDHGFKKDNKKHSVDVRVAYKDGDVILRIRDNCAPFDPAERQKIADPEDITSNIGIRMVYKIAKDVFYQNILGLNVLTIKI